MLNFGGEDRRHNGNNYRPEVVDISWKECLDCEHVCDADKVGLEVGSRDPADGDRLGKAWSRLLYALTCLAEYPQGKTKHKSYHQALDVMRAIEG
jgi:hypothetical protein